MKNFQLLYLIALIIGCTYACTNAQIDAPSKNKMEANFKAKYPNVKDVSWGKDDNGNYEAKFEQNGEKYRADFTPAGDWIETENDLKWKHLPKTVQDAIERTYDKDDIEEIEQVHHHQKGIFYDIEIDEKGKKKFDVEYNGLGKVIGRETK